MRDYKAKADQGKTDWSLLPWDAIEQVAEIMTQAIEPKENGGSGYGLASWKTVPGGFFRYWSALMRHGTERFVHGKIIDPASGKYHTAHMACCILFICSKDMSRLSGKLSKEEIASFYERDIK